MSLRTLSATLLMTALLSGLPPSRVSAQGPRGTAPAAATTPAPAPGPVDTLVDRQSASHTRERLHDILNTYPPALGQVLRLDPSLVNSAEYLASYPGLAAFFAQHPEIARSPEFFLGEPRFSSAEVSRRDTINALEEMAVGIAVVLFFMAALVVVSYVSRSVMEHRRWLHAMKVQTDAHTKIVDRLASNDDLMAYMQSPAGQRFLSATAIAIEPDTRLAGTPMPLGRILMSVQIGVVAAFGGVGLWVARNYVISEVAQPLSVLSILGMALGLGFVSSAVIAYLMSRHMGLIRPSPSHA